MQPKINYVMIYTGQVTDILTDKLTMIFNRATLGVPIRLHLCLPHMFDVRRTYKYRELFEEVSVSRFSPESAQFWNLRNLIKFQQYCTVSDIDEVMNIFVDQSVLINRKLDEEPTDVLYRGTCVSDKIEGSYRSLLEVIGGEAKPDFECWDFGATYLSNDLRKRLYFRIDEFVRTWKLNRYLNTEEANILLTIFLQEMISASDEFKVRNMQLDKITLDDNLVQSIYSLL